MFRVLQRVFHRAAWIKQNSRESSGRVVLKRGIKPRSFSVSLRWAYNFLFLPEEKPAAIYRSPFFFSFFFYYS